MPCLMAAGGFDGDDEQATTTVPPYSAARLTVTVLGVWNLTSLGKSENGDQFPKPYYRILGIVITRLPNSRWIFVGAFFFSFNGVK